MHPRPPSRTPGAEPAGWARLRARRAAPRGSAQEPTGGPTNGLTGPRRADREQSTASRRPTAASALAIASACAVTMDLRVQPSRPPRWSPATGSWAGGTALHLVRSRVARLHFPPRLPHAVWRSAAARSRGFRRRCRAGSSCCGRAPFRPGCAARVWRMSALLLSACKPFHAWARRSEAATISQASPPPHHRRPIRKAGTASRGLRRKARPAT
mmetsp:Transcript_25376/g.57815  ORF Transcript_25376/g.57815 Transcript_25376/m.57815 type:complete len:213 (+) Transcript_25376:500-1138(+)